MKHAQPNLDLAQHWGNVFIVQQGDKSFGEERDDEEVHANPVGDHPNVSFTTLTFEEQTIAPKHI